MREVQRVLKENAEKILTRSVSTRAANSEVGQSQSMDQQLRDAFKDIIHELWKLKTSKKCFLGPGPARNSKRSDSAAGNNHTICNSCCVCHLHFGLKSGTILDKGARGDPLRLQFPYLTPFWVWACVSRIMWKFCRGRERSVGVPRSVGSLSCRCRRIGQEAEVEGPEVGRD